MADLADLEALVEPGEALRHQAAIRHGGRVGVTDERVIVVRPEQTTSVHLETIREVTIQSFDWYLGLLSAIAVGFGIFSLERSVIGALAFVAFGLGSLYWTYRKRGQVQLHLHERGKAVTFSLDATDAFEAALGSAIDRYEAGLEAAAQDPA
ncbi:MAG: hypothetical protein U5J98_11475 [Halobacteriales archaeon]|nr:hypothetical protein [Halobacteriales archaeon]